jgi:hypothetical protein
VPGQLCFGRPARLTYWVVRPRQTVAKRLDEVTWLFHMQCAGCDQNLHSPPNHALPNTSRPGASPGLAACVSCTKDYRQDAAPWTSGTSAYGAGSSLRDAVNWNGRPIMLCLRDDAYGWRMSSGSCGEHVAKLYAYAHRCLTLCRNSTFLIITNPALSNAPACLRAWA